MAYPLESAVFQWEDGKRALESMRGEPTSRAADRFVEAVREELRRRVGASFTMAELADHYGGGTDWCLRLAGEIAPALASRAQTLADAAFWLHAQSAADYGGSRLTV